MSQTNKINQKEKYYVTMTDRFLSNWEGTNTENKVNKYVIECDTWEEAQIVKRNALQRTEMSHVHIAWNKPRYNKKYYVMTLVDKKEAGNFFKAGFFNRNRYDE